MKMSSFWGCCDAGDVIDGQQYIISITRGSGGNVSCFLPGVRVDVNDRKEGTTGCDKWLEPLKGLVCLLRHDL